MSEELIQVPVRMSEDLRERVDKRRREIGEDSRNAWIVRVIEWALDQPVKTDRKEIKT